ncbi:hypothetical protein MTO96_027673 [Rhipicephalus appendiculatus]
MEVPVGADETSSGHPAKRRAVSSNADSAANRVKYEIREVLNSLSTDIKQLGEQLNSFRAGVAQHFAVMNARIENLESQVKVSDPAFPTRRGTSTTRDSVPDLTFVKNVYSVQFPT